MKRETYELLKVWSDYSQGKIDAQEFLKEFDKTPKFDIILVLSSLAGILSDDKDLHKLIAERYPKFL